MKFPPPLPPFLALLFLLRTGHFEFTATLPAAVCNWLRIRCTRSAIDRCHSALYRLKVQWQ